MACYNCNNTPCTSTCGCPQQVKGSYKDFTGFQVKDIEVLNRIGTAKSGASVWLCRCKAGHEFTTQGTKIKSGNIKCQKCNVKPNALKEILPIPKESSFEDYSGYEFNSFVINNRVKNKGNDRHTYWLCKCKNCGEEIVRSSARIKKGTPVCYNCKEINRKKPFKPLSTRKDPNQVALNLCYCRYKKTAKRRNLEFTLTQEQFKNIVFKNCGYCGDAPSNCQKSNTGGSFIYNGIDRIDNSKGYNYENCAPCCIKCNYMKHTTSVESFIERVEKIYHNFIINK